MPSVPSKKPKPGAYPTFHDLDDLVAEQEGVPRTSKKKGRNAPTRQTYVPEELPDEEIARENSPSPSRPQSILGRTSGAFDRNKASLDVLDALGTSQKVSDQYPNRTDEWAREVPYGKSPPGDSLAGLSLADSPPVANRYLGRGGFSTRSPPVSPRQGLARPVSYGGNIPPLPSRQNLAEQPYRQAPSTYGSPPAPHLPQPHFYIASDVNLGLGRGYNQMITSDPSFVGFSHIALQDNSTSKVNQPVILVGSESRLDVLANLNKLEPLGALSGLPGTVVGAEFLTWESGHDPFLQYRPLVALTLHGPRITDEPDQLAPASDDGFTPSIITTGGRQVNASKGNRPEYQTRVEVYSLAEKCHICTLLKLPPVPVEPTFRGQAERLPTPAGNIRVDVQGSFLTVSSGTSGEVYAFGVDTSTSNARFKCLGKFWTSVQPQLQRRESSHGRSTDADISPADLNRRSVMSEAPILSMSSRWLAITPATSPSRPTLGASLGTSVSQRRSQNRDLRNAPSRPVVTCEVDSPDADTLLSKAVREVAQGVARGTRWLADQGMQTWNNYWKKEQPPSLSPRTGYDAQMYPPHPPQFPPTHSLETQTNTRDPDLVSIFDLKALDKSSSRQNVDDPKPVATFQPPNGCSFLSFMPNGLGLLTVSRKGDVQYVWDLMQIKHCRLAGMIADNASTEVSSSPRVRQLAKFPRLTASTVVDVVWESAVGDRFALVTKNGTVHVYDLPLSAFRWPPPRRTKKSRPTSAPVDVSNLTPSDEPLPAGRILSHAWNIAGRTQPILANLRGRAPSMGTGIGGIGNSGIGLASATGARGSRVVAAGLSKSLGAATGTVNNIRHAGENRLHLRSLTNDPTSGRVAWNTRSSKAIICVLDKAAVRSYFVRRSHPREGNRQQPVTVFDARKATGLKLPNVSTFVNRSTTGQETASNEAVEQPGMLSGWCSAKLSQAAATTDKISHPLSHAEIDTSAPYQPFHSDARVNLYIYPEGPEPNESRFLSASTIFDPPQQLQQPRVLPSPGQWVFGNVIPGHRLKTQTTGEHAMYANTGSVIYRETITSPTKDGDADELVEQIVSTTRRRKKKLEASHLESSEDFDKEGFFEDDCDVLDFAQDRV